MTLNNEGRCT